MPGAASDGPGCWFAGAQRRAARTSGEGDRGRDKAQTPRRRAAATVGTAMPAPPQRVVCSSAGSRRERRRRRRGACTLPAAASRPVPRCRRSRSPPLPARGSSRRAPRSGRRCRTGPPGPAPASRPTAVRRRRRPWRRPRRRSRRAGRPRARPPPRRRRGRPTRTGPGAAAPALPRLGLQDRDLRRDEVERGRHSTRLAFPEGSRRSPPACSRRAP